MSAEFDGGGSVPVDRLRVLRQRVWELGGEILDSRIKGLRLENGESLSAAQVGQRRWNLLEGALDHPALVLKESALANNVGVMATYCRDRGVQLAPHGKTTMSPELFLRQLEAGAWGITAATAWQVRFMRSFGVPRILLANELVDPTAIGWVLDELDAASSGSAPGLEFLCYVDSEAGISIIEDVVAARGADTPLPVLVEFGYPEGRSGCRTIADAMKVAERAAASPAVRMSGVSAFEGLMPGSSVEETMSAVKAYMSDVHEFVETVARAGLCDQGPMAVSSGGSAYFDIVADTLGPDAFDFPVVTILRSGCYVTHDAEMYEFTSQLGGRSGTGLGLLEPALELWATVWSRPTPELAIVGFGKRDCPYDYRLPVPLRTRRPGSHSWQDAQGVSEVVDLNDQHAFVRIPADSALAVGDEMVVGVSHPCGAFDKWNYVPVVDEDYTVIDGIFTFF